MERLSNKSYFVKSKLVHSFLKRCSDIHISDEKSELFYYIEHTLFNQIPNLPTIEELIEEYDEHVEKIGEKAAQKHIVDLWSHSMRFANYKNIKALEEKSEGIGVVWEKHFNMMVNFFRQIGVPEINLHPKYEITEQVITNSDNVNAYDNKTPKIEDRQLNAEAQKKLLIDEIIVYSDTEDAKRIIKTAMGKKKGIEASVVIRALIAEGFFKKSASRAKIIRAIQDSVGNIGSRTSITNPWDEREDEVGTERERIKLMIMERQF